MSDARTQITEFWSSLDETRRRVLGVATGAAVVALTAVAFWASQPQWVPLSRISDGDTRASVVDQLSRAGIQWRLGPDGSTLEVLAEDEATARREAAGEHGLVGLSGVDQLDPWITPFQEQMQKQRMLQEELVMQLNGITGVQASRVLLNLKSGTGFLGDNARASASVSVKSDEGVTLGRDLGKSIAQLVSHSVAGMTLSDVTVIDQRSGRLLWSGDDALSPEVGGQDEAVRRSQHIAAQATEALAAVLGSPDRVRVSVQVDLETASSQSTVNAVDPDAVAALQEKAESDANSTSTPSATDGGVAGVQSNTPSAAVPAAGSSAAQSRKREQTETRYAVSTSQTTTIKPAGELRKLSAAVFVDSAAVAALATASKVDETQIRTELERSVKAALGVDEKRGDSLVVSFVPFAEETMSDATLGAGFAWERLAPSAVALVAVILTFLMVVRPLLRSILARVAAANPTAAPGELPPLGQPILGANGMPLPESEQLALRAAAAYSKQQSDADAAEQDDKVIDLAERLRRQVEGFKLVSAGDVSELVQRETDHSAEVLRRWIRS